MPFSPSREKLVLILRSPALAVAAALLMRIALLWLSHRGEDIHHPRFNTVGLEEALVASSLAQGKGFGNPFPGYQAATAILAPAYSFLWAIGIKLFSLTPSGSIVFSQTMNSVFSAATCWPIFGIGKRVFNRSIGLASAWLWAFLPYAILLPLEWTWDQSLSALLLAVMVNLTFALTESKPSLWLTGYGLLWGASALVNPTLCVMFPFLLTWMLVRRGPAWRKGLASAAQVIIVFVLAVTPWTIRNYYAIDGLVFVKSNFGMEFWLGNNPQVKEVYTPELHPSSNLNERILMILNGEPNYNRIKQRQAMSYIRSQPAAFFKNTLDRVRDTWSAYYDSRVEPWPFVLRLSAADVWFCSIFSLFSFAGMILSLWSNWRDSLPLAMCILFFPIPYYFTHTALRYRHPIDPILTILAVYAAARAWSAISGHATVEHRTPEQISDL